MLSANRSIDTSPRAGSYMTFSTGSAHFAIQVSFIRYITSRDAVAIRETPDGKGRLHKVFEFEGKPIVMHRFSRLVGARSLVDDSAELVELLRQRRQDHVDWVAELEASILSGKPFSKATDPHLCAFGLWYDQYKPTDPELKEIMARFDIPHCRIHALAKDLLELASDPEQIDKAIAKLNEERHTTLKTLLNLFAQAENRLQDMVKPVVMIVKTEQKLFALELDNIEDIHEFEDQHWLQDCPHRLEDKPCYDGFFQKDNGHLFIKLDPHRIVPGSEAD